MWRLQWHPTPGTRHQQHIVNMSRRTQHRASYLLPGDPGEFSQADCLLPGGWRVSDSPSRCGLTTGPSCSLCGPAVWRQCRNPRQGNNIFTVYCPPLTAALVPSLQIPDNNIILLSYYRNQSMERSAQTLMSYSPTLPHKLDRSWNPTPIMPLYIL